MKEPSPALWPRGLLVGALLAGCLILPVFLVMVIDAAAGTARLQAGSPDRFTLFQRPVQLRGSSGFFAGRLAVQAVISQRFGVVSPEDATHPAGARPDPSLPPLPVETACDNLFRLRLENRSQENVAVEIVRVDSALGAFVSHPDRLTLAPGQTASIDSPVYGQPLTTAPVPVEVALRLEGNVETQQLVLRDRTLAQAGR